MSELDDDEMSLASDTQSLYSLSTLQSGGASVPFGASVGGGRLHEPTDVGDDLDLAEEDHDGKERVDPRVAAQELRSQYIRKAKSSFAAGAYRDCLRSLKSVSLTDRESIVLLVEASYRYWRDMPLEMHNEKFGKTAEQQEAVDIVKNSFTALLGDRKASHLVTAFDFIRLSHVYLAEGALPGALQILQLASARGHLENSLVVLQSLTALSRLGPSMAKECENHITFFLSEVTLEARDPAKQLQEVTLCGGFPCTEWSLKVPTPGLTQRTAVPRTRRLLMTQNSNLPLAFLYLASAVFLKKRAAAAALSKKPEDQKRTMELVMDTVAEAFQLYELRKPSSYAELLVWFSDGQLFYEAGMYTQQHTAFVLLAEDFFWEAYLRMQLSEPPLEQVVLCMKMTKRGSRKELGEAMMRAFKVNRWSPYARRYLLEAERLDSVKNKNHETVFGPRFQDENDIAEVIQGIMRSVHMRKFKWPSIYRRAKAKREAWLSKVAIASAAWKKAYARRHKELINIWRTNARALHILRKASATRIQTVARRRICMLWLVKRYQQVLRTNAAFLQLAHLNYDLERVRTLRAWEQAYRYSRLHRASTCLQHTLLANGYGVKLKEAMDKILAVRRVMRRYAQIKLFPHWLERYRAREKKHARVSIRFFTRAVLARKREAKKEAAMVSKVALVERLMAKSKTHIYPLKRDHWRIWRMVLRARRVVKGKILIASAIPRSWARLKAKRVVQRKRVFYEIRLSFEKQMLYRRVGRNLRLWRTLNAARHIQRMWRQTLARIAYKRWKRIVAHMAIMKTRQTHRTLNRQLFLWNKFCFLRRRTRHRMSRRISIFFKKIVRNRRVIRATRRKPRALRLLTVFHLQMLKRAFKKMNAGATASHTEAVLAPVFLSRWRQCVRLGFSMWRRKDLNQKRMLGIIQALTVHRIDKKFWPGCGRQSVRLTPKLALSMEESRYRQMLPKANLVMSWEAEVPQWDVRYRNLCFFRQHRSFRVWMACMRYRHRLKMSYDHFAGAHSVAEANVLHSVRVMFLRARQVIKMQCAWRTYVAKKTRRVRKLYWLRVGEAIFRLENKPRWKVLDFIRRKAARAWAARLSLQCFYRQWKARRVSNERARYLAALARCVETVNLSSKSARALLSKHMRRFVVLFVYSVSGEHTGSEVEHKMRATSMVIRGGVPPLTALATAAGSGLALRQLDHVAQGQCQGQGQGQGFSPPQAPEATSQEEQQLSSFPPQQPVLGLATLTRSTWRRLVLRLGLGSAATDVDINSEFDGIGLPPSEFGLGLGPDEDMEVGSSWTRSHGPGRAAVRARQRQLQQRSKLAPAQSQKTPTQEQTQARLLSWAWAVAFPQLAGDVGRLQAVLSVLSSQSGLNRWSHSHSHSHSLGQSLSLSQSTIGSQYSSVAIDVQPPLPSSSHPHQQHQRHRAAQNSQAAKRMAALSDAPSPDLHAHLYRLRQTGVFVFEAGGGAGGGGGLGGRSSLSINGGGSTGTGTGIGGSGQLTLLETAYLLEGSRLLFVQNTTTNALSQVWSHFAGEKMAFCGGTMRGFDMTSLLHFGTERRLPLALHWNQCECEFAGVLSFVLCLGGVGRVAGAGAERDARDTGLSAPAPAPALDLLGTLTLTGSANLFGYGPGPGPGGQTARGDDDSTSDADTVQSVRSGHSNRSTNQRRGRMLLLPGKGSSSLEAGIGTGSGPGAGAARRQQQQSSAGWGWSGSQFHRDEGLLASLPAPSQNLGASLGRSLSVDGERSVRHARATLAQQLQLLASAARMPEPQRALACLRELAVDTVSFGALGVLALLACMKDNISLEILTISFSDVGALLPSLGKALRSLGPNSSLRELRLLGAPLPALAVQGLGQAVYSGLRGLRHLEVSVAKESDCPGVTVAAEQIIELAKMRAYAGRMSLNVSIN